MNRLRIHFLVITVLFAGPSLSIAQETTCQMKMVRSPALRGLRLRMAEKDIVTMLKVTSMADLPADGRTSGGEASFIRLSSRALKTIKEFDDIESLWLDFYKSRLARINIRYSKETAEFESVTEFVSVLSEKFDVPLSMWSFETQRQKATLTCPEFEATAYSNSTLVLTDTKAFERKQKEFRP